MLVIAIGDGFPRDGLRGRGLRTLYFVLFLFTLDSTLDNRILLMLPKTNHIYFLRGLCAE